MKVFVYSKKNGERVAEYNNVIRVVKPETKAYIDIFTNELEVYRHNTNKVKC